jgi:hypothetical protein
MVTVILKNVHGICASYRRFKMQRFEGKIRKSNAIKLRYLKINCSVLKSIFIGYGY